MVRMTDDPTLRDARDTRDPDPPSPDPAPGSGPAPAAARATEADDGGKVRRGAGRDKVLAGVCHGAGRYFDVDPVIFRVVLVVLSLTGGIGLIVYGMGWLVIPLEGEDESEAHRLLSGRIEGAPLTAVLMALVGCGLYASMIGNGANQAFSLLLLTATAGAVYWSQQRGRIRAAGETPFVTASAVADAPPAAQAPPEPGGTPSWWRDPLTKEPGYLWGPDDGPYEEADRQAWRERKRAARGERSWLFALVVFLLVVAAAAIGTGASWQRQPTGVAIEIGLSAALGVLGFAYLTASFAGRPRGGTVFWTLVIIVGLIGAAAVPKSGQGLGGTTWRPTTAGAVRPSYERGVGTGTLDLTGIRLNGATVHTRLKLGAGQAVVRLPKNATVRVYYRVSAGDVRLPGDQSHSGVHVKTDQDERFDYGPAAGVLSTGTVDLEVLVGAGELEVTR